MSQTEINGRWMTLVVAILTCLTASLTLVTHCTVQKVRGEVHEVEVHTNSLMTQLIDKTDKAAHAEGKVEGKLEQKAETNKP